MKDTGYFATESELIAIVRRMDIDSDNEITFSEFCDFFKTNTFLQQPTPHERFNNSSQPKIRTHMKNAPSMGDSKKFLVP